MSEKTKGGLQVLFFYIGIGIALLFAVISGIHVVFNIINHLVFSDSVGWYQMYNSTEMPVQAAFLLVSFIILVLLLRKVRGAVNEYQGTIWYTLCRTIVHSIITASVAMAAIAVSILFGAMLSGEISLNNSLKTICVAGVGLVVLYYYRGVLHGIWREKKKQEKVFVTILSTVVGLTVLSAAILLTLLSGLH